MCSVIGLVHAQTASPSGTARLMTRGDAVAARFAREAEPSPCSDRALDVGAFGVDRMAGSYLPTVELLHLIGLGPRLAYRWMSRALSLALECGLEERQLAWQA